MSDRPNLVTCKREAEAGETLHDRSVYHATIGKAQYTVADQAFMHTETGNCPQSSSF